MTEEKVRVLQSALADLQPAFHGLKAAYSELQERVKQKNQWIEELEGQLLKERLRHLELEKRLAKDNHNSSKLSSSDGYKRQAKRREKSPKNRGGQAGHLNYAEPAEVKRKYKTEFKDLKRLCEDTTRMLAAQRDCLERLPLTERS